MTRRRSTPSSREVLEELFADPPVDPQGVKQRLRRVERDRARTELVEMVRSGAVGWDVAETLMTAIGFLGVGNCRPDLQKTAVDATLPAAVRAMALAVLSRFVAEAVPEVLGQLPWEDAQRLLLHPTLEALAVVEAQPELAALIAEALLAMPPESRRPSLEMLEERRRQVCIPVVTAYGAVLAHRELADLHGPILERVVAEDPATAAARLEALRDRAEGAEERRLFQAALMRLATRSVDAPGGAVAVSGSARIGTCDGQGAFILLARFGQADGSIVIADLCIRAGADVRDGFVMITEREVDVEDLIAQLVDGTNTELAPIPLPDAALIAVRAVERTRLLGQPIPPAAEAAILRFARATPRGAAAQAPPRARLPAGTIPPSLAEVKKLLDRPLLRDSWFLDAGDLAGAGVGRLPKGKARAASIDLELKRIAASEIRPRIVAMADHMALWHRLHDEGPTALRFAALAEGAERDCASSPLARVILERSLKLAPRAAAAEQPSIGDPDVRTSFRQRFFVDVEAPKGRDLARLDFAEAAHAALSGGAQGLPGHLRPRESELDAAAFAIGSLFAALLLKGRGDRKAANARLIEQAEAALVGSARLDPEIARALAAHVLRLLAGFPEQVCANCPVDCLSRPNAAMAEEFWSDVHPLQS